MTETTAAPVTRTPSRLAQLVRWSVIVGAAFIVAGNLWIEVRSRGRIFSRLADVQPTETALVLGTSNRLRGGHANPFFVGRINAAAELYRAGKVRRLLLSGDNRVAGYDEPSNMRQALLAKGVPEAATELDYAGFRTLDSMARAKNVFRVTRVTIVTDDFHAARSILLARHFGLDAQAYTSSVRWRWSKKTRLREIGARAKALLDLYLLRTQPHFVAVAAVLKPPAAREPFLRAPVAPPR